jgi:hypothetical protein
LLQSSYAKAINIHFNRTGSLFQQKAKFKLLEEHSSAESYSETCFHYIHQNPLKAGLVDRLDAWQFSSFSEYLTGTEMLCNRTLALRIFNIAPQQFASISYAALKPELLEKIF